MHGELAEQGEEDVGAEDVRVGPGGREGVQRPGVGDEQEEGRREDPAYGRLDVPELDAVQVHDAQNVGRRQAVEPQDLEHLESGHEGAPALPDDVDRWPDGRVLGRERRGHGGIAELHDGRRPPVALLVQLVQHLLKLLPLLLSWSEMAGARRS